VGYGGAFRCLRDEFLGAGTAAAAAAAMIDQHVEMNA